MKELLEELLPAIVGWCKAAFNEIVEWCKTAFNYNTNLGAGLFIAIIVFSLLLTVAEVLDKKKKKEEQKDADEKTDFADWCAAISIVTALFGTELFFVSALAMCFDENTTAVTFSAISGLLFMASIISLALIMITKKGRNEYVKKVINFKRPPAKVCYNLAIMTYCLSMVIFIANIVTNINAL